MKSELNSNSAQALNILLVNILYNGCILQQVTVGGLLILAVEYHHIDSMLVKVFQPLNIVVFHNFFLKQNIKFFRSFIAGNIANEKAHTKNKIIILVVADSFG